MAMMTEPKYGHFKPHDVAELVGSFFGATNRPDDEKPHRPGPWDPVLRSVLRTSAVFGPHPDPWRGTLTTSVDNFSLAALNPQPLPPRIALVAALGQELIARAELIGESAARSGHSGAAAGYVTDLIDDWCGTPPRRFPWPWPGPRPNWVEEEIGALDHLVLASILDRAMKSGIGGEFAHGVRAAQQRLIDTALSTLNR